MSLFLNRLPEESRPVAVSLFAVSARVKLNPKTLLHDVSFTCAVRLLGPVSSDLASYQQIADLIRIYPRAARAVLGDLSLTNRGRVVVTRSRKR